MVRPDFEHQLLIGEFGQAVALADDFSIDLERKGQWSWIDICREECPVYQAKGAAVACGKAVPGLLQSLPVEAWVVAAVRALPEA